MARSCGLRIGSRRFELVVLDGNPKKSRIVATAVGEFALPKSEPAPAGPDGQPAPPEDPAIEMASVLAQAVKQHGIPTDNVGIAIDTGRAAFRTLTLPITEKTKIEQVLKFEVEGMLPQWNIDDVVVDFLTLEASDASSELLVTAVPKSELRRVLDLCAMAGVEPQEAELEATAMVNAALAADLCKLETAQLLVHIGEISTSVVIMDSGKVREMRAIHLGALSHETTTGTPAEGEPAEGEPAPEVAATAIDAAEKERRLDQAIRRIRRELGRTISAARTVAPIEAVYVCGFDLPGLEGSAILDVPVKKLDVFETGEGNGVGERPAGSGTGAELVVAYGAALRQLGAGRLAPALRREELRYSGALERLELPIAVVALLLVTLLGVWNIFLSKEREWADQKLGVYRDTTKAFLLGGKGRLAALRNPSDDTTKLLNSMTPTSKVPKLDQLTNLRRQLESETKKLEKDLGQDTEIPQPQSALTGLTLVLDVLEKQGTELARPSIRKVTSIYQKARGGASKGDSVRVSFDVTFFADSAALATNFYDQFKRELKQGHPWYVDFEEHSSVPLEDGKGIFLSGIAVVVDVNKAPAKEATQ
jgi:hypothetical protein